MMVNNITGDKMFAHIDRVFGEHKPITADIFLNNYCNNNCPYCTYKRWEFDDDSRSMRFDDFVKYANRLIDLGVVGFILTGGGEPTISKDFDKIVDWLDANNIKYGINTNFNRFVKCSPEYLKVSLDAWNNGSYIDRRGVARYNKVRQNIVDFARVKSDKTKLGIQLLARTVEEVRNFYTANKDLPVDYISIRPMESTAGSYYQNLLSEEFNMQPVNIITTIKQLHSLDSRVVLNYKWEMLDVRQPYCTAQWAQIAINESGEVMYCCHKPYEIIGHIMDDDILEKKASAITNMSMCDVPCRMTGPNYEVYRMTQKKYDTEFI
jgi:molybdenum cofactor biosynthesis enzyme MoaA